MSGGRGERGNREVSPLVLLGARGDLRAARVEACLKEGGSWERYASWDDTSEPKASDGHRAEFRRIGAMPSAKRRVECRSSARRRERAPRASSPSAASTAAARAAGSRGGTS